MLFSRDGVGGRTLMTSDHHLLIACDDAETVERIGTHVTSLGYDLRFAGNLEQAFAEIDRCVPDLVICGWELGGLAGAELIKRLRKPQSGTRFILLVQPDQHLDIAQATRQRVVAFLPHPYQLDDLSRYIKMALDFGENHPNRREYNRYLLAIETHCIVINPFADTESRPIAAIMRDVSRSGLAMLVRQVIPVPSMLKVVVSVNGHVQPVSMLAKSISCTLTQIPDVYRLGAKFVGLLPREFEKALAELGHPDLGQTDIYMGRSFKDAIRGWLTHHKVEISSAEHGVPPSVAQIAEQIFGEIAEVGEGVAGNGNGNGNGHRA